MRDIFEVALLINENEKISQRDLSRKLDMSLGKINTIISEMQSQDLLLSSDQYRLSRKGMSYLESNRVDNAVIMAAGFGSRFVPITYDTPKGLIEVKGERMIERLIKQLHEAKVNDITIVVGYLKEKFEYLSDKYNVKLLYNPDYSEKNNISSLFHASKSLKNTYVLPSDIYLEDNIFREYEAFSYYASVYSEGPTNEWLFELSKQNKILSINPEGGSDEWIMYGPAFLKEDLSRQLNHLIELEYPKNTSAQWYWEDVLMRNIDSLAMYVRKFEMNSILEFESIEDLRKCEPNYLFNANSDILNIITTVFHVHHDAITNIRSLKEGMTNDSFLFSINDESYVFRVAGKGTDVLINRRQEAAVYTAIKPLGISDDIVYFDENTGYKITKYISNSRNLDISSEADISAAMKILRALHESQISVEHDFDIEERIEYYISLCKSEKAHMFEDFDDVYAMIRDVITYLNSLDRPKNLCHIDSIPLNFLFTPDSITLLDWEYAGMADPIIDVAMHIIFDDNDKHQAIEILRIYLQNEPSDEDIKILYSYIALSGFLWSLWTQYKQAQGEDFGTYGMDQYRYGRNFSRYVLEGDLR